jgi:hypothetical protein
MQRRNFLKSAGVVASLSAVPFACSLAAATDGPRLVLLRAAEARAGTAFLPLTLAPCATCADPVLQVSIGSLHSAEDGPVLEDLAVHAMFDMPDGGSVPFVAWCYSAGQVASRTDSVRFVAGRSAVRRLEFDYRIEGEAFQRRECCSLIRSDAPLLAPGHYVLLGPRRDGTAAEYRGLVHTGNLAAPLPASATRGFDYLPIRIEAAA